MRYLFSDFPDSQGSSYSCVASAITHQMETATVGEDGNFESPSPISSSQLYGYMRAQESGVKLDTKDIRADYIASQKLIGGSLSLISSPTDRQISADGDDGIQYKNGRVDYNSLLFPFSSYNLPLESEESTSYPLEVPRTISQTPNGYRITRLSEHSISGGKGPSMDLVKRSLDSGSPLVATIANSERDVYEGWLRFKPGSRYSHVLQVVKYDTAVDPYDGKEKEYFLVRDSLCNKPLGQSCRTYSIPAHDFMGALMHLQDVGVSKKD